MKQICFIILMLISIFSAIKAQEVQIDNGNNPDFNTEISKIIGQIDKSPITSNILLDKTFPFIELPNYQGTNTLADSNLLDINDFGSIYATLYGASLDSNTPCLPNPDAAYMDAVQSHTTNVLIPITGLLFRYEQFKPNAISDRLLEWQGNILADVPNRPTHPYRTLNTFAASPIVNYSDKRNVVFSLPAHLFHYNMGMTYALEIDFDDSRGFRSYSIGQSNIPILYPDAGLKKIKFRIRLANNTVLICHALFEIVLPDPSRIFQGTPDITLADITLSSSANGATIRGFSNCGDGRIRKPLIWIEGFNPTTTLPGFNLSIMNNMRVAYRSNRALINGRRIWDYLEDEGYDLIYVDFLDGAGDLRENSKVVQAVIRAVNAAKIGNEPIVLLGESMGGVLSKHALRTMERAGEAHNCRLFFAFDSPLRGANVPIGLQHMAEQFINLKAGFFFSIKDFLPSLQELENILHSPAAKQMLSHHVSGFSAHNSFYGELAGLGELANCRQVCISNGSDNGSAAQAKQMINMTIPLLSINSNMSKFLKKSGTTSGFVAGLLKVFGVITGTKAKVKLEVNAIPEVNTSFSTIYKGKIVVKLLSHVIPLVYSEIKVEVKNFRALDNAPGGINGQDLDPDVVTLINNASGNVQDPFMFCFVPTVSALDLRNPEVGNPFLNVSNYNQMVSSATTRARAIVASNLANFSTFGVNQENQFHISFTNRNGIFFLRELTNEPNRVVNTGLLFSTYNFGATDAPPSNNYPFSSTTKVINRNQNLNSSSTNIWINRNGNLEFPFSSLFPACRTNATFGVFVRKNRCGNAKTVINVSNGGSLLLGEQAVNNTGNLTLEEESEIINTTGGNLTLENNSVLTITSGTKLEQTGGLITLRQNSKIIVQNGGIFNITGGTLTLNSDSKIIVKNGGVMNIDAGMQNLINNGQIIVEEYGILNVLNTSNIKMSNTSQIVIKDKGKLFLKRAINAPQNIILTGDGGNLAPIIIKGSLTTEVVIQMKDAAVLQFEKTNKLFVNMSKFHVECAVPQNIHTYPKMIVLMPDTKLKIPDVDLYLRRGTIYYNSRSQIELAHLKNADLAHVRFQGAANATAAKGLTAVGYPRRLSISSCYFTDVNMCIDVRYPLGTLPVSPYIHIANTKMEKYSTCGLHLVNPSYVIMASCHLISNYANDSSGECVIFGKESHDAPAMVINNKENPATQYPSAVPSSTFLYDVTIEGEASHWANAYNDANQYYDRTKNHANQYIEETNEESPSGTNITKWGNGRFSYLVGLFDMPNFVVNNGFIQNGFTGIYAPVSTPIDENQEGGSNVTLYKANINNNLIGMLMDGSEKHVKDIGNINSGRVDMQCAVIEDNFMGILGTNIWLNIDHILFDHSNYFKYKTLSHTVAGSYMDIVYFNPVSKYPNGILATRNRWDDLPNSGVNYHINTCRNSTTNPCIQHNLLILPLGINEDCTDYQGRIAETLAAATPQQKATVVLSTGEKDLLPQFLEGLRHNYLQDYNAAINSLSEIANLGDEIRDASDNPYLQSYIDIARTIAPRITLPNIGNQKIANIKNSNPMFVFPNPAEGFFKLVLPSGRYDVQLSDVLGRVIKQVQVADYEEISTENIQSGLYQITVRKKGEQAILQTGKIVVKE